MGQIEYADNVITTSSFLLVGSMEIKMIMIGLEVIEDDGDNKNRYFADA
ncbi:MAG: hypothetical protein WBP64_00390 [Nitrososphaeraceae archaeon]